MENLDGWFNNKELGIYTVLTFLVYALIYLPIPLSHKMYIYLDIGADTYSSYWPLYGFLWDYVHSPAWAQWSFQMGLGNGLASSIMFLLDPYNIFLLPFDKYNIDVGIFIALTAKVFSLATLAFLYLRRMGHRGVPLISGSLAYTFCGYFIGWGQHYHFATAFIFFTLILLSLEIWIQIGKRHWLIVSVSLMSLFSVYFLFMSLLFLSLYYLFRFLQLRGGRAWKFFQHGWNTFLLILSGILLSAFSVLPQIYALAQSPRVSGKLFPKIALASINEYITILARLLSNNLLNVNSYFGFYNFYESPFLYTGILTLVMLVPLLLLKNKYHLAVFLIVLFCLMFPSVSNPLFNGLNIYGYRWTFVLVPVMTNGLAIGMEGLYHVDLKKAGYGVLALIAFILLSYASYLYVSDKFQSLEKTSLLSLAGVIFFLLIYSVSMLVGWVEVKTLQRFFVLVLVSELSFMGYISVNLRSLVDISAKSKFVPYFDSATNSSILFIKRQDEDFYRINKLFDYIHLTDALYQNYYGEKYYSSTMPTDIWEMQELFGLRGTGSNYFYGFLDSQSLRDVSSVKYMLSKTRDTYAGYDYMVEKGDVYVYMNEHALPLGFIYNQYIPIGDFRKMSVVEREDIIYDAVILPDNFEGASVLEKMIAPTTSYANKKFNLSLSDSQGFLLENGEFLIQPLKKRESGYPYIDLSLEEASKTSVYLNFSAISDVGGIIEVSYKTRDGGFSPDNIYIYNVLEGENHYFITIPAIGVEEVRIGSPKITDMLKLADFYMEERNDKEIELKVDKLRNQSRALDLKVISEDHIKGTLSLGKTGFLYFSIPYNEGWSLDIDGDPVELVRANIAFMGADVGPGKHTFELKYSTPMFFVGKEISLIVFVLVIIYFAYYHYSNKNKKGL